MYYVYVLLSLKDKKLYIWYTNNLNRRIKEHQMWKVESTKYRKPLQLIYYEACLNQKDALHREKYLKTTRWKRYLKNRLKNHLNSI